MLLAYLDEAYNNEQYWMTALACPCENVIALQDALDEVCAQASRDHGIDRRAELHGHALMQGKDHWTPIASQVRARIGVFNRALKAIAAIEGVRVILRGVDRPRLIKKYARPDHPHAVTLQHALQSLHRLGDKHSRPILVIADEIGDHDVHRESFWSYRNVDAGGRFLDRLSWMADTMHFAPSHHSRLLQAADLVSYIHYRRTCVEVRDPRAIAATENLYSTVEPLIEYRYCWRP